MDTINTFKFKQRKYIPNFPKASGKPTIYIQGYPCEDEVPMPATEFHGMRTHTLFDQFLRYFQVDDHIHVGMDNFIYYREGDLRKVVAPDVYVVLGAARLPLRRSFYTWAEGAVPTTVFEFLSDATADEDRNEKVAVYLRDIGVAEYFIHQPEMEKPVEFRGWRRSPSGDIVALVPDAQGGLFSAALNLYFRWEEQLDTHVRLLRPYLPDGTPITTSIEEHRLRLEAVEQREDAETRAAEEAQRRQDAETRAAEETQRRQDAEVELERLRRQLANRQDSGI